MLEQIVVQTDTVVVNSEQSFKVKGLTMNDVGILVADNFDAINTLMEKTGAMNDIATKYPEFMAKVIAMGASDYDNWKLVTEYPFALQLTAFEKVWDLTIPDYEALGKLVERIKGIIQKSQEKQATV